MKNPMYGPLKKSYNEDINDLVEETMEKGGVGSGRKGHRTMKHDEIKKRLMNLTSFDDKPGHFLGYGSLVNAVKTSSGVDGKVGKMLADDMIRSGHFKKIGKVYIPIKKDSSSIDKRKVQEYVDKYRQKFGSQGLLERDQKDWLEGAGLNESEVKESMKRLKPKTAIGNLGNRRR